METVYACTHYTKEAQDWTLEEGAGLERWYVDLRPISITAPSLAELAEMIRRRFGLPLDELFLPIDGDEPITGFGFSQVEDNDGNRIEPGEEADVVGEMFLADYSFSIEKRVVTTVDPAEFAAAGIKTH